MSDILPHESDWTDQGSPNSSLQAVTIAEVSQINTSLRTIRLDIAGPQYAIDFLPGQWLRFFLQGIDGAGKYYIVSTPSAATARKLDGDSSTTQPYVKVVVESDSTPQAQRLWADIPSIIGLRALVCVEGGFVWPPESINTKSIDRAVFIAIGAGVNPFLSMLSTMHEDNAMPREVHLLYTSRVASRHDKSSLFGLETLLDIGSTRLSQFYLYLFLGGHPSRALMEEALPRQRFEPRQILDNDVFDVFQSKGLDTSTVCYVCGPPMTTDHFLDLIRGQIGLSENQVFSEKLTANNLTAAELYHERTSIRYLSQ